MHICPRLMALLKEQGADRVAVIVGGIIPEADIPALRAMGVQGVFLPGAPMREIVEFVQGAVQPRAEVL